MRVALLSDLSLSSAGGALAAVCLAAPLRGRRCAKLQRSDWTYIGVGQGLEATDAATRRSAGPGVGCRCSRRQSPSDGGDRRATALHRSGQLHKSIVITGQQVHLVSHTVRVLSDCL